MSDALLRARVRFFLSSILFAFCFHAHAHTHARDVERSLGVSVTYGGAQLSLKVSCPEEAFGGRGIGRPDRDAEDGP